MQASARDRLLRGLDEDALVLDIGGWADPFERADWVMDLMPYESRGLYEREGWIEKRERGEERFSAETWISRDICDHAPYPFGDAEIDFVICSHTLEDLRDPVWVCAEMNRIAKAGYIEVPSRLEEQSWGVHGPHVGWSHHRWLIDVSDSQIEFVVKLHSIHARKEQHFPAGFWQQLTEEERVQALWWQDAFGFRERLILDPEESDAYLADFITRELAGRKFEASPPASGRVRRLRDRLLRPGEG